jgi:hypothetical protein
MFRNAHRPGVVRGFSPAALVATLMAEDLVSEHDHMVVAVPEIRISAALCQQRPGERFSCTSATSSSASNSRNVQTGGWLTKLTPTRPAG